MPAPITSVRPAGGSGRCGGTQIAGSAAATARAKRSRRSTGQLAGEGGSAQLVSVSTAEVNVLSAPLELRVSKDRRTLHVAFADAAYAIPAELLRVESPSAEVQGHDPSQKKIVGAKRDVTIENLVPTGRYAIRIVFSDGHDTGLYSWEALRRFGTEQAAMMADYEAALARTGQAR